MPKHNYRTITSWWQTPTEPQLGVAAGWDDAYDSSHKIRCFNNHSCHDSQFDGGEEHNAKKFGLILYEYTNS